MFDIGWSELLVIAVVAIIVVGPKDLPGMLRAFGKTMSQVRRTANDFKRQFNEALREAEDESGLKDTSEQLKGIGSINPVADVKQELNELTKEASVTELESAAPKKTGAAATPAGKSASEPTKTKPAAKSAKSGSDAA
jgi:sec-independent protein translocase protein TatB